MPNAAAWFYSQSFHNLPKPPAKPAPAPPPPASAHDFALARGWLEEHGIGPNLVDPEDLADLIAAVRRGER